MTENAKQKSNSSQKTEEEKQATREVGFLGSSKGRLLRHWLRRWSACQKGHKIQATHFSIYRRDQALSGLFWRRASVHRRECSRTKENRGKEKDPEESDQAGRGSSGADVLW